MRPAFITLLFLLHACSCPAQTVDVFFITGQSNAGNVGVRNGVGSTDVGFNLNFARIRSGGNINLQEVFDPYSSSNLDVSQASNILAVGLHSSNDLAVYCYARGGRPLANADDDNGESWFPGEDPQNGNVFNDELYGNFIVWANSRLASLTNAGLTPVVRGIFWFQGERDVILETTDVYQTNFENLVFRFRQDFGQEVVIVPAYIRIVPDSDSGTNARQAEVNESLASVAQTSDLIRVVPVQDLPAVGDDNVHLTTEGYRQLADRWAAAYQTVAQGTAGDVNGDGSTNLLDVGPFVGVLSDGGFSLNADINGDGRVNLVDVGPFVDLLNGG